MHLGNMNINYNGKEETWLRFCHEFGDFVCLSNTYSGKTCYTVEYSSKDDKTKAGIPGEYNIHRNSSFILNRKKNWNRYWYQCEYEEWRLEVFHEISNII